MVSQSSLDEVNKLIRTCNPFDRSLVVTKQAVWGQGFPDVPSLNAHASDAVFEAIEKVRQGQRQVVGMTIKAEKGLGKSHIISRIRHRLQEKDKRGAWFIYMSDYSDLNRIKPEFLNTLALSLKQVGSQEVMQWQELATDLVNEAMNRNIAPKKLVESFQKLLTQNPNLVDDLTDNILQIKPDLDNPYLIQAILWTLSSAQAQYAINWITGKGLSPRKADQMGLPNSNEDQGDTEAFERICQILNLISSYNPVLICFDQLEGTESNDSGFTKAQVIANLGMDLYNSLRSGVILTALYPDIWTYQIRNLPACEAVIDRIGEKIVDLEYLKSDHVVDLVSRWLKDFYEEHQLTPPDAVYPFQENALRELGKERATARDVLQWCIKHWLVPDSPLSVVESDRSSSHAVESAFAAELNNLDSDDFLEDKAKLAKAIEFGFSTLIGETLDGVTIERLEIIKSKSIEVNYSLDFKVIGQDKGKPTTIGVMILQVSGGRAVQAGLKRLVDYHQYNLTRGCLIRSKTISPSAKLAQSLLQELLNPNQKGGEWVMLKSEEVKPLLAIRSVYDTREDYELTEEQIFEFINTQNLARKNPLILEILSDPSGQVPEDAVDEDADLNLMDGEPELGSLDQIEEFELNEKAS
jgi:hypothetical protein